MPKPKPPQPIPDPPLLVLAKVKHRYYRPKHKKRNRVWFVYCRVMGMFDTAGVFRFSYHPHEMTVVEHPRNDPEAVEIIKNAQQPRTITTAAGVRE